MGGVSEVRREKLQQVLIKVWVPRSLRDFHSQLYEKMTGQPLKGNFSAEIHQALTLRCREIEHTIKVLEMSRQKAGLNAEARTQT